MTMNKIAAAIAVSLLFASSAPAHAGPTLDAVKNRGALICAINGNRAGFSSVNSKGEWSGLDVDTCHAIAAAVLGDASKVRYLKTTSQTRFTVLQTGEVDVTASNATWTLSRDADLGLDFVTATFYDGQGFMVPKKLGVKTVKDLDNATICVRPGSTSEKVLADLQTKLNIKFNLVVIEDQKAVDTAFFGGRCDAAVQSTSGLSSTRVASAPNPDDYVILPGVYGKDPEGPIVRQGDAQWRDIVQWTVFTLFQAEESGVTSANVDELKKTSKDPAIRRLLGEAGPLGKGFDLDPEWAYRIIKQVGNYGEIYERSFGKSSKLDLPRNLNKPWTEGGLLYAPPFD
jgi:general L-amino acid transport system substrate-binding protein